LEVELVHVPGLWQRPPEPEQVAHPIPGEERGAREELLDLRLVQAESSVNLRQEHLRESMFVHINQPV